MLEAFLFLGGAVLFLVTVIFFIYVYQERLKVRRQADELEQEEKGVRIRSVELDIQERELQVWQENLQFEHRQLEVEREELRMLTATTQSPQVPHQDELQAPLPIVPAVSTVNPLDKLVGSNKDKSKLA